MEGAPLLVVMNVVNVKEERREAFERAFLGRDSHVHKAEGFAGFELLRRDGSDEYVVLSRWQNVASYEAWRDGDLFRRSHRHAEGELAEGAEVRSYEVLDSRVPA
jgi:heme oxygenase (mycobilin-producing)